MLHRRDPQSAIFFSPSPRGPSIDSTLASRVALHSSGPPSSSSSSSSSSCVLGAAQRATASCPHRTHSLTPFDRTLPPAMAEWSEHAHYGNPTGPVGIPPAVTALSFDPYSELLWQGTSFGTVSSLYSSQLSRYTSYLAHGLPTHPSPTKGILADERHIFSVGDNGIKAAQRRGLAKWSTLTHDFGADSMNLVSMCASPLAASSDLVAAGLSQSAASTGEIDNDNDLILTVNNSTGALLRSVPSEAPIVHVRKSGRYICAATVTGHIQLRDPRTLKVEHRLHAHPGGLVDVQADGNILYSVGWTVRQGHPVPEPLIRVHDLRSMRALVPIPFAAPGGPSLLAIHPKLSSTIIVSAPQGQFQIVDIATPAKAASSTPTPPPSPPPSPYLPPQTTSPLARLTAACVSGAAPPTPPTSASTPSTPPHSTSQTWQNPRPLSTGPQRPRSRPSACPTTTTSCSPTLTTTTTSPKPRPSSTRPPRSTPPCSTTSRPSTISATPASRPICAGSATSSRARPRWDPCQRAPSARGPQEDRHPSLPQRKGEGAEQEGRRRCCCRRQRCRQEEEEGRQKARRGRIRQPLRFRRFARGAQAGLGHGSSIIARHHHRLQDGHQANQSYRRVRRALQSCRCGLGQGARLG